MRSVDEGKGYTKTQGKGSNKIKPKASGSDFISRLPKVRGSYRENVKMDRLTWFRVGGPADVVFRPEDISDLCHFLKNCPKDIPIFPLGVGSNVIIRDGGIRGVVIRLGRGFQHVFSQDNTVDVGAGLLDKNLSILAGEEGWGGLEFFCGIPGTIGGALRMNAGCYGSEVKDILEYAVVVDRSGRQLKLGLEDLNYSYRHCGLGQEYIFVGARFKFTPKAPEEVQALIQEYLERRESTQPIRERTGGSTFANPSQDIRAWELIDKAGLRGLKVGGAEVSTKHCNFMINTGSATAQDLEALGEEVRRSVLAQSKVSLRWEIIRVGDLCEEAAALLKNAA